MAKAFGPGDHGTTFGGNPLACAAANVVLDRVPQADFLQHVTEVGDSFKAGLENLQKKYPEYITEVRGEGLILGAQLTQPGRGIVNQALEKGVIINCTVGTVLRFIPPLIITKEQVDEVLNVLDAIFAEE